MKLISGFLVAIAVCVFAAGVLVWSGWHNVAAGGADISILDGLLHTAMQRSVRRQATDIVPPADLQTRASRGFQEFDAMCVQCHGAPGRDRGDVGKGLHPQPPSLANAAQRWSHAELFWIVKYGVRMTGMPAFGITHDDDTIWTIVAFVSSLQGLSPRQYDRMGASQPHDHHNQRNGTSDRHHDGQSEHHHND